METKCRFDLSHQGAIFTPTTHVAWESVEIKVLMDFTSGGIVLSFTKFWLKLSTMITMKKINENLKIRNKVFKFVIIEYDL